MVRSAPCTCLYSHGPPSTVCATFAREGLSGPLQLPPEHNPLSNANIWPQLTSLEHVEPVALDVDAWISSAFATRLSLCAVHVCLLSFDKCVDLMPFFSGWPFSCPNNLISV